MEPFPILVKDTKYETGRSPILVFLQALKYRGDAELPDWHPQWNGSWSQVHAKVSPSPHLEISSWQPCSNVFALGLMSLLSLLSILEECMRGFQRGMYDQGTV